MTWPQFFTWLRESGFHHSRGDVHWQNAGWWFPKPPEELSSTELPGWWVRVYQDRESDSVFVESSSRGRKGTELYADEPLQAKKAVDKALTRYMMESDQQEEGGGSFGAPVRGGGIYRFVQMWAEGTLGRKLKEGGSMSVQVDGPVVTLYSYAVPIASILDGKYVIISDRNALERTSLTTNAHLKVVENVIAEMVKEGGRFTSGQVAHLTTGRIPRADYEWTPLLIDFDARTEGSAQRLRGLPQDDDDVSDSCDLGAHERCSSCGCGCHIQQRPAAFPKKCGCGKSYTEAQWEKLKDLGAQVDEENGIRYTLHMRNCTCGSTLATETQERM